MVKKNYRQHSTTKKSIKQKPSWPCIHKSEFHIHFDKFKQQIQGIEKEKSRNVKTQPKINSEEQNQDNKTLEIKNKNKKKGVKNQTGKRGKAKRGCDWPTSHRGREQVISIVCSDPPPKAPLLGPSFSFLFFSLNCSLCVSVCDVCVGFCRFYSRDYACLSLLVSMPTLSVLNKCCAYSRRAIKIYFLPWFFTLNAKLSFIILINYNFIPYLSFWQKIQKYIICSRCLWLLLLYNACSTKNKTIYHFYTTEYKNHHFFIICSWNQRPLYNILAKRTGISTPSKKFEGEIAKWAIE